MKQPNKFDKTIDSKTMYDGWFEQQIWAQRSK